MGPKWRNGDESDRRLPGIPKPDMAGTAATPPACDGGVRCCRRWRWIDIPARAESRDLHAGHNSQVEENDLHGIAKVYLYDVVTAIYSRLAVAVPNTWDAKA